MANRPISGRSLLGRLIDGRALGIRVSGGGKPGTSVPTPPLPPTIEWDEDDADSRPDFDVIFWYGLGAPQDTAVDDVLRMQYSTDSGGNWNAYLTHTFTSDDIAGTPFSVSGASPLGTGSYLFRARIERGSLLSDWSASEDVTLDVVAVAAGIGWPWLWIPNSGSNAGQPTGPWLWLLQG